MALLVDKSPDKFCKVPEFKKEFIRLRECGITEQSGRNRKHYIRERVKLVLSIKDEDEERINKLLSIILETKDPDILGAILLKIRLISYKEFQPFYWILLQKSSESGQKNSDISLVREMTVSALIRQNKTWVEESPNEKEKEKRETEYQKSLLFVSNNLMSESIFNEIIKEIRFPDMGIFKAFYSGMLSNRNYIDDKDLTEARRKLAIKTLFSSEDKDFIKKALVYAFKVEASKLMLLRIRWLAGKHGLDMDTILDESRVFCINATGTFTEEERKIVFAEEEEEARQKINEAKEKSKPSAQALEELDRIIERPCSASLLLEEEEGTVALADMLYFQSVSHKIEARSSQKTQ